MDMPNNRESEVDEEIRKELGEPIENIDTVHGWYLEEILAQIFRNIIQSFANTLDQSFLLDGKDGDPNAYRKTWKNVSHAHPHLREELLRCCRLKPPSFTSIYSLDYLQAKRTINYPKPGLEISDSSYKATVTAWSQKFRGKAHMLLYDILKSYMKESLYANAYARCVPFVQSSGTGKSRMLDELAKHVLCIPINLEKNSTGSLTYPPADHTELQTWIRGTRRGALRAADQEQLAKRYRAFVCGLLSVTLKRLQVIQESNTSIVSDVKELGRREAVTRRISLLAAEFREKMTQTEVTIGESGLAVMQYGQYRQDFYNEVMSFADDILMKGIHASHSEPASITSNQISSTVTKGDTECNVASCGKALRHFLDPSSTCADIPLLIICIDEAHSLSDPIPYAVWTRFSELQCALRDLRLYPFFTIFLSTAGDFHLDFPNHLFDPSNRIQVLYKNLYPPITEVPFDEFAEHVSSDGEWALDRLASTYHIAHLGRSLFPARYDSYDDNGRCRIVLFAREKLLGRRSGRDDEKLTDAMELACLAVRLGLEFRRTNWLDRVAERTQVERHMRICLAALPGFRDMITISPSEPLLAEAASQYMLDWSAAALLKHIESSYISVGERGELVASLIVLLARDSALVHPDRRKHSPQQLTRDGAERVVSVAHWLDALVNSDDVLAQRPAVYASADVKELSLSEAFKDAYIWFNHFIKVNDYALIGQEYLWRLIARGAAVVCANGQRGLDILVPILFRGVLCKENVSAVLIQVKNDKSFTDKVRSCLFDWMDPFEVGLFSGPDKATNPVIRMVFALASETSAIAYPSQLEHSSPESPGEAMFTSYDIWCAGATSKTYKVIKNDEEHDDNPTFNKLLLLSRFTSPYELGRLPYETISNIYTERGKARRIMHPGVGKEEEHHLKYVEGKKSEDQKKGKHSEDYKKGKKKGKIPEDQMDIDQ